MLLRSSLHARSPLTYAIKPLVFAVAYALSPSAIAGNNTLELNSIPVTGNPLGANSDELVVPVTVLNGRELSLRRESTLGETLNGTAGVSATQYGPNASRPVIRGLDAERVKIMQNGVGVLDASSLSFDHAVGVDPLIIEQIDVVRGPAALLYGGSAVGGVVNAIDHRIPKEKLEGVLGRAEARFGGADNTRNGAAVVDVGNGMLAIHADAYARESDDLRIPGYAVSARESATNGTARTNKGTLLNSGASGSGGALGAALTFDHGYLGSSFSTLNNNYGIVAEPNVRIDMQSNRWDVAGEMRALDSAIERVKVRMAYTDYIHKELESGVVGTTFKNSGVEGSIEAAHAPIGKVNGVIGYQFNNTRFQALGDEAFVPSVTTQSQALYIYEELPFIINARQTHKITFGGRFEDTAVNSQTNASFGTDIQTSFQPNSFALGGIYSLSPEWSLTSNLSHNERAPSYFELFAKGAHIATDQFEVGNPNFKKETSNGIDAQIRWKDGANSMNLGVYYTRFDHFIGLFETGATDPTSGLNIAQFSAVPASFKGAEADAKWQANDDWAVTLRGDYVIAKNLQNDSYLPRIAPLRLGSALIYQRDKLNAKLDVTHAFKQDHIAANELVTDAYTNVSARVAYKLPLAKYQVELFAKANNLLNDEIRESTSFLKDIAPAGGRSIVIGARADF